MSHLHHTPFGHISEQCHSFLPLDTCAPYMPRLWRVLTDHPCPRGSEVTASRPVQHRALEYQGVLVGTANLGTCSLTVIVTASCSLHIFTGLDNNVNNGL